MDPRQPSAEAIAIQGDSIVFVGSRYDVKKHINKETQIIELGNNALLPGFIDAHGHLTLQAKLVDQVNLSSPPIGQVQSITDLIKKLKQAISEQKIPPGEWVAGYGYDDSLLAEKRHPTRDDLDQVSTTHPIYLSHVSGHLGVANSAALAAADISTESENPPGGLIRRRLNSQEPNGVLEETATTAVYFQQQSAGPKKPFDEQILKAIAYYVRHGITTIQDGGTSPYDLASLRKMAKSKKLKTDVVAYLYHGFIADQDWGDLTHEPSYNNGLRLGGIKFLLDGSPQGRTAWMTKPYDELPVGAKPGYRAYPTMEPKDYVQKITPLIQRGIPIIVHANGDAAIDLMLDGVEEAFGDEIIPNHRSVIIHSQLMRPDQINRAAQLGAVPSFFSAHTFFWGDWHRRSFGENRAAHISPSSAALDEKLPFTIHNDTPVVPPDMMRLLWATVNRKTRSDYVLGPDQRVSIYDALHAITLGAAYQYFEEEKKGSLTVGKQADLVILATNPLTANPDTLKNIEVVETIARGQTIYRKQTE